MEYRPIPASPIITIAKRIINSSPPEINSIMIKIFSEFLTNIILLSTINNEAFMEAVSEIKNIVVIIVVRLVFYWCERVFNKWRKNTNE